MISYRTNHFTKKAKMTDEATKPKKDGANRYGMPKELFLAIQTFVADVAWTLEGEQKKTAILLHKALKEGELL